MDDDNAEDDEEVAYPFPNGIISEAGKIILTIDFLMTCSGKRIGELFHLKEKESGTMVTLRWVMELVPKKEMAILGKELHDEALLRIHEDVKMKHVEKLALKRWKFRLEDDERLKMDESQIVVDPKMLNNE